ncbi:MAG: CcmB protein [Bacteroidetes bacterium ADurb.Bin408]|nr:MAG: CcmB protein [Bacteroidetes bacterium ADurb.Bin408]
MLQHIKHLIIKDLRIEWRQKHALGGALLYIISTVFICYLALQRMIDLRVWSALFWIIIVFVGINSVSRSFLMESRKRYYYYQTITSPGAFIMGKTGYNNALMSILSLLTYLAYSLFFRDLIQSQLLFLATLILGSMGLSSMLTMTSAIAWKAGSSLSLVAILSFPLALPMLTILIKLTKMAGGLFNTAEALKFLLILLLLNIIINILSYILFPFIWKD